MIYGGNMKAIMIAIKPQWCAKIMNGEKTIEVRNEHGEFML
jgi:predicted transcriptional regulator